MRFKRNGMTAGMALCALLAAGCLTAGCSGVDRSAGADGARTLRLATWVGPTTPYGKALQVFADDVAQRSQDSVTIELFWDGALLAGPDLLTGAGDGRTDLAYLPTQYNPADLPLSQLTTVPFLTSDIPAAQAAWEDLLENDQAYQDEWSSNGVEPLTVHGAEVNILASSEPATGADWLKGKSVRANGYSANAIKALGADPVALQLPEIYESLERGLISGYTTMNLGTIPSVSLQEVAPYVADAGLGMYATALLVGNEQTLSALPEDVRAVLDASVEVLDASYGDVLGATEDAACTAINDAGGKVSVWPEAETAKWKSDVGDTILNEWIAVADRGGDDGAGFYDRYMDLLDEFGTDYETGVQRCASSE